MGRGARRADQCRVRRCRREWAHHRVHRREALTRDPHGARPPPVACGSTRRSTRVLQTRARTRRTQRCVLAILSRTSTRRSPTTWSRARDALLAENRRDIRRVTELRFAQDLAPKAMEGYVVKDAKGMMTVARLPSKDDPYTTRIERIRERDGAVVDTVNGYYANFPDSMKDLVRQLASFELRRDRKKRETGTRRAHAPCWAVPPRSLRVCSCRGSARPATTTAAASKMQHAPLARSAARRPCSRASRNTQTQRFMRRR